MEANMSDNSWCDISDVFNQISSWSKEREESQKQLDQLLSTFDDAINKKVKEMIGEVDDLQDKLSVITKERDDLLVYVEKLCDATEKLKAKIPDETPEEDIDEHTQEDTFEMDNQETDIQEAEIPHADFYNEEKPAPESMNMESDACNNEKEVQEHFCPNCQLFFSSSDELKFHLLTMHSNLENNMAIQEGDAMSDGPNGTLTTVQKRSFNSDQLVRLNQEFDLNPYPNKEQHNNLANEIGLNMIQIKKWFKNKRADVGIKRETFKRSQVSDKAPKTCAVSDCVGSKVRHR